MSGGLGPFMSLWLTACRKERRVFERYVQECRAGQERKDRAEIEALRNEVSGLVPLDYSTCTCSDSPGGAAAE